MTEKMLDRRIDDLLDGEITEAEFLQLEAELSVDPAARQRYYQRVGLVMLLEEEAESHPDDGASTAETSVSPRFARRYRIAFAGMAATVAALLLVVIWVFASPDDSIETIANPPVEADGSGFAVIAGQTDAVWANMAPLSKGSLVPTGPLQLTSGVAQLELFSGVTVVVEGNAEFAIHSPMEMSVTHGKLRAHVPAPAQGFRIQTSEGEVVDLGTEFAVSVSEEQSEIHVLDGEVEWHPKARPMLRMATGEAIRWSAAGESDAIPANDENFIGVVKFRQQLEAQRQSRRERWLEHVQQLQQDERLVAYYRMASPDPWTRQLPNLASGPMARAKEGAIVAAATSADRFGHPHGALDFNPTGSRVRVTVPGTYGSLTMLCWVKINSLDRWYNSLFLTDGHELHEPHWQIMDDGRLFFSVKKRDNPDRSKGEMDKHVYYSPSFWKTELSGQWLMIATVYDLDRKMVTHYLNGDILSEEAIPQEYLVEKVTIGDASLCNWGLPKWNKPHFAVRNLNGNMDEFALFSAALSANEIKELYKHGKP